MILELIIFALVMVFGAVVAYRTRSVPSAWNESSHISTSLQILVFFLLLLVPLDWGLIGNTPEASVALQGGGQSLVALFILTSNFLPKLYYLIIGKGDDQNLKGFLSPKHNPVKAEMEVGGMSMITFNDSTDRESSSSPSPVVYKNARAADSMEDNIHQRGKDPQALSPPQHRGIFQSPHPISSNENRTNIEHAQGATSGPPPCQAAPMAVLLSLRDLLESKESPEDIVSRLKQEIDKHIKSGQDRETSLPQSMNAAALPDIPSISSSHATLAPQASSTSPSAAEEANGDVSRAPDGCIPPGVDVDKPSTSYTQME
jgi:hypothetical protein